MISIVTTTTTAVTIPVGLAASLGLAVTIGLIVSLTMKELLSTDGRARLKVFSRNLDVAILPLLMVFAMIVVVEVVAILS